MSETNHPAGCQPAQPSTRKKSHHGLLGLISFRLLPLDWQLQFCTTQQGDIVSCVKVLRWLSSTDHSEDWEKLDKIFKCMPWGWDITMNISISSGLQLPLRTLRSRPVYSQGNLGNFVGFYIPEFKTYRFFRLIAAFVNTLYLNPTTFRPNKFTISPPESNSSVWREKKNHLHLYVYKVNFTCRSVISS